MKVSREMLISLSKRDQEAIHIAKWACLLIFLVHPGWALGIHFLLPGEYNDLMGRTIIGFIFLALLGLKYTTKWVDRNFIILTRVGYWLFGMHWFTIVYRSEMDPIYIMGTLVVSTAFTYAFNSVKPLVLYSIMMVAAATITAYFGNTYFSHKFMLVAGTLSSQFIGVFLVRARSRILDDLEQSEERERKLKQDIIDRELEAARVIQSNLLAPMVDDSEHFHIDAYYQSAGKTGGDWYGYYTGKDNKTLYLWIGDVTGHGLSSAMVTAVACGALYSSEKRIDLVDRMETSEDRLLYAAQVLNEVIIEKGGSLMMTMLFCALDLETGKLTIANAGHRQPLIREGKTGIVKQIKCGGDPLGFQREMDLSVTSSYLAVGDLIFVYTDGLVENVSPGSKPLTRKKIGTIIENVDPENCIPELVKSTKSIWGRDMVDDTTFLTLHWKSKISAKKAS